MSLINDIYGEEEEEEEVEEEEEDKEEEVDKEEDKEEVEFGEKGEEEEAEDKEEEEEEGGGKKAAVANEGKSFDSFLSIVFSFSSKSFIWENSRSASSILFPLTQAAIIALY